MRLKDKVAAITGGGSGIGRAAAILFAREGAGVGVVDIDGGGAGRTVASIEEAGGRAVAIQADISTHAGAENAINQTVSRFGKLDILYSNAGIAGQNLQKTIEEVEDEDWQRVLDVNLKGVYLCARYAVPHLKRAGGGAIVHTASIAGMVAFQALAYGASKGAVVLLTKSMANQLAPFKIRVNAVAPGFVETPLSSWLRLDEGRKAARLEELTKQVPLGRVARPEEIAQAALYLAADEASYVTGHVLVVDGGYTAR